MTHWSLLRHKENHQKKKQIRCIRISKHQWKVFKYFLWSWVQHDRSPFSHWVKFLLVHYGTHLNPPSNLTSSEFTVLILKVLLQRGKVLFSFRWWESQDTETLSSLFAKGLAREICGGAGKGNLVPQVRGQCRAQQPMLLPTVGRKAA